MTAEQLKEAIKAVEERADTAKRAFYKEYALSNNPYKIGDVITDQSGSLQIQIIKWAMSTGFGSECVYRGTELNKDGRPSKKQTNRAVYQSNVEHHSKQPKTN